MKIQIKGTNFPLTLAISDYIEKRLEGAMKFFNDDPSATVTVEVGKTSGHHKHGDIFRAEIHAVMSHSDVFVAAEKEDLYAAIDAVRDEFVHRLSSDKGKKMSRMRRGGAQIKSMLKGLWPGKGRRN
jgi:putative sigma-54 modulation protein